MLSSNQTLSPYTRRTSLPYSRLAYLFIVLFLLFSPLPRPSPPPPLLSRPFSRQPPLRHRLQSFRLPTPYKRSCCPFITTTPATTTTERPTTPQLPSPHFPFVLQRFPPFIPSSYLLSPSSHTARTFLRFFLRLCSQAPPRSLLTL